MIPMEGHTMRGNRRLLTPEAATAAGLVSFAFWLLPFGMSQPFGQTAAPAMPNASVCTAPTGDGTPPATAAAWADGARLFDGLGDFHRPVSTGSKEAQTWFDQGMRFLWAFNHDEATRSFAKAAQIDPGCAMCWWGVSLTVGPNYNLPVMAAPRAKVAWEALRAAI